MYSQNDEDGILEEILHRLNLAPGQVIFVELGVENGSALRWRGSRDAWC